MKKLTITTALLFTGLFMFSQNSFKRSLGEDLHTVEGFITQKKDVNVGVITDDKITAFSDKYAVTYLFAEGKLSDVNIVERVNIPESLKQGRAYKSSKHFKHPKFI